MIHSILIVILALALALFAQQNTQTVSLTIGNYAFSPIPVYFVVIASLLLGLLIAGMFSMMDFVTTTFTLRRKDLALQKEHDRAEEYKEEVQTLKRENAQLQERLDTTSHVREDEHDHPGTYLENLRNRFAFTGKKGALS